MGLWTPAAHSAQAADTAGSAAPTSASEASSVAPDTPRMPPPAPPRANAATPSGSGYALEDLRRWHQWGLYDSVLAHGNPIITTLQRQAEPEQAAEALLLRASAHFARGDTALAVEGFQLAACLDGSAALDSFYVSPALWRLQDGIRRRVLEADCPAEDSERALILSSPDTVATGDSPAGISNPHGVAALSPPAAAKTRPLVKSSGTAWKKPVGWTALGLGAGAAVFTGYAFLREADAYADLREAGTRGDEEAYREFRHDRKDWRRMALAGTLVSAASLGVGAALLFFFQDEKPSDSSNLPRSSAGWKVTPDGRLAYRF